MMNPHSLNSWAKQLELPLFKNDITITGFAIDSREVKPGYLFIAIPGEQVDGHDYIEAAKKNGATAVLVSRNIDADLPRLKVKDTVQALGKVASNYWRMYQPKTVAITGSCGKTTLKQMITSILSQSAKTLMTPGNRNTDIGVPLSILELTKQDNYAVLEMGACHKGDIEYLTHLFPPNVAVLNNVAPAHLEHFLTEQNVAEAKGEIYAGLQEDGVGVLNLDQRYVDYWLENQLQNKKIITFAMNKDADVTASDLVANQQQCYAFELNSPDGKCKIQLKISGKHNVANALAAAAVGCALTLPVTQIKKGLEAFEPVNGRLVCHQGINNSCVIDDTYNANPASTQAAIEVLSNYAGKKILVLGNMAELGENKIQYHTDIGKQAKLHGVDVLLGYGDLMQHAVSAFGEQGQHFLHKAELIEALKSELLAQQSTVLVKGSRSMKMEDIVNSLLMETV